MSKRFIVRYGIHFINPLKTFLKTCVCPDEMINIFIDVSDGRAEIVHNNVVGMGSCKQRGSAGRSGENGQL